MDPYMRNFARVHGIRLEDMTVEHVHGLVPDGSGGWMLPPFKNVLVDGHCVPAYHEDLYRRIHALHGHLVCGPVSVDPHMLMTLVKSTMDRIAEIESARDDEVSRWGLDLWIGVLTIFSMPGFSERWLGWLKPRVEELEGVFRDLEFVERFRRTNPELADRIMEAMKRGGKKRG